MPIQHQVKDNAVVIYALSEQGFMRSSFLIITSGRTSVIFLFSVHFSPLCCKVHGRSSGEYFVTFVIKTQA